MGRGTRAGLFLSLLGLALLIVCSFPVRGIGEVINTSFTVSPGTMAEKDYHTSLFTQPALTGEVVAEGEGIYLTVNGYNTQHLKNLHVKGSFTFTVDPAHDIYYITFDNAQGSTESLVKFTLKETRTCPLGFWSIPIGTAGFTGFFLFIAGLATLVITSLKPQSSSSALTIAYIAVASVMVYIVLYYSMSSSFIWEFTIGSIALYAGVISVVAGLLLRGKNE